MSLPSFLLRLEALALLAATGYFYQHIGGRWSLFALLFLIPDLFMLGYLAGPRLGSVVYDVGHNYVVPGVFAVVVWSAHPSWLYIPVIWIAHIAFDRVLGYGIKYPTAFRDTHLQRI